jgi:hypothetical protein
MIKMVIAYRCMTTNEKGVVETGGIYGIRRKSLLNCKSVDLNHAQTKNLA